MIITAINITILQYYITISLNQHNFAYYTLFWCDEMLFIYIIIIIYINNYISLLYNTCYRIFAPKPNL